MYSIDYDLMKIFVQQTWGPMIRESLEVNPTDTIEDIKSKLSLKLMIPTDDQILLYDKQPLSNSCTLLNYKIPERATLDLRRRLTG